MNSKTRMLLLVLLLSTVCAARLAAQNYAINWFTIDGGGGTSTGGAYSISGTIGQPDAGEMRGGNYTLVGGFWGVAAAVQTEGAPYLYVTNSGGTVIVSWAKVDGFVLDQATTLASSPVSWSQVAFPYQTNATQIYITVPSLVGNRFYRLRKP
jgi:hypothetical protein